MTTAELDPEFPSESTALNVTVVAPRGNTAGASFETETTPSPASTALAAAKNAAISESVAGVPSASTAATVISAGALTTGPTVSLVVEPVAVFDSNVVDPVALTVIAPSGRELASTVALHAPDVQSTEDPETVVEPPAIDTTTETPSKLQVPVTG